MNLKLAAIRVLLVDDEPLALTNLRTVLAGDPSLEIVAECGDGPAALDAVATSRPELVFLDVQMPGMDGVEVARQLLERGDPPVIVFVTAYDQFAVEAFEVHALDYLLKPYSDQRLLQAAARSRSMLRGPELTALAARLTRFVEAHRQPPPRYIQRLLIPDSGRTRIVLLSEVRWIGGAKNYVEVHTSRQTYLHRQSMEAMAESLDPRRFVRIHRSSMVCLEHVREVVSQGGRRMALLDDGTRLPISQTYAEELMDRLGR